MIYHICIKTMSVKGGICAHEAYEAKKIKIFFLLCEHITPTQFLYIYIVYTTLLCRDQKNKTKGDKNKSWCRTGRDHGFE